MLIQAGLVLTRECTKFAFEWPDLFVNRFDVRRKIAPAGACKRAKLTFEWLDFMMNNFDVPVKVASAGACVFTLVALEGFAIFVK